MHTDKAPASIGLYAGFGPFTIGYSRKLGQKEKPGQSFPLNWMASYYGLEFSYTNMADDMVQPIQSSTEVRLLAVNGYFAFNCKRFSYSSAYKGKLIQKRSAGSVMLAAKYLYGNFLLVGMEEYPMYMMHKSLITPRATREGRELVSNIDYTDYEEGIYIGYRYFTTSRTDVAYPFGYGLSYTFFNYEKPSVEASADGFVAWVTVRNTGSRPGREMLQLYVSAPSGSLDKPARELKGFAKTRLLAPGESETVEIPVSLQDLASWNEKKACWETARGVYHFCIGRSADKMQTDCSVLVKKTYLCGKQD